MIIGELELWSTLFFIAGNLTGIYFTNKHNNR